MGCWAIGGTGWGGSDDEAAKDAIRAAIDLGDAAVDTAPVYGRGRSERVVGEAIAGRRDEVLVLTKCGLRWDCTDGHLAIKAKDEDGNPLMIYFNSRPESVRLEVEQSLARLGTDRIDLLQVHWPDPTTPIAETMGALVDLVHEGKVRAVGVSNYSAEQMDEARAALGDVPLASDQPRYSLVHREIEADVLPYAREHGVGLLVYSPLEQGLLTGTVTADRVFGKDDGRYKRDTFTPENRARVNAILDEVVRPVAERAGGTLGQTCLAWLLAQDGVTSVLAGARTPAQVRENAHAAELELTADELTAIDDAFAALELAT
jgi:aryl-alcohol dehydrogenase-like predicted oxidoreductase